MDDDIFKDKYFGKFMVVELNKNIFLLEHILFADYYLPICPIYNNNGVILNDVYFNDAPKRLDIQDLFNIRLKNEEISINFGNILFNIDNEQLIDYNVDIKIIENIIFLIYNSYIDVFNLNNMHLKKIYEYFETKMSKKYKTHDMYYMNENYEECISRKYKYLYLYYINDYIKRIPLDININSNRISETYTKIYDELKLYHIKLKFMRDYEYI